MTPKLKWACEVLTRTIARMRERDLGMPEASEDEIMDAASDAFAMACHIDDELSLRDWHEALAKCVTDEVEKMEQAIKDREAA